MSIWDELEDVQRRLIVVEARLLYLEQDVRARLKEEAEDRELQDQEYEKARWEIEHDL